MLTLWDLLVKPVARKRREARPKKGAGAGGARSAVADGVRGAEVGGARVGARTGTGRAAGPSAQRYARMEREMLAQHGIRVRKWRRAMSGCAWAVRYADGRVSRLIESPKPTGPVSASIFLHEVGHHAIGLGVIRPRCLEEYAAWAYSIGQMRRWGVSITPRVVERVRLSLEYAVEKGARRGMKAVPAELAAFLALARDAEAAVAMLAARGEALIAGEAAV